MPVLLSNHGICRAGQDAHMDRNLALLVYNYNYLCFALYVLSVTRSCEPSCVSCVFQVRDQQRWHSALPQWSGGPQAGARRLWRPVTIRVGNGGKAPGAIRVVCQNNHATFVELLNCCDAFLHAADFFVAFGFECFYWIQVVWWKKNSLFLDFCGKFFLCVVECKWCSR